MRFQAGCRAECTAHHQENSERAEAGDLFESQLQRERPLIRRNEGLHLPRDDLYVHEPAGNRYALQAGPNIPEQRLNLRLRQVLAACECVAGNHGKPPARVLPARKAAGNALSGWQAAAVSGAALRQSFDGTGKRSQNLPKG